MKPLLKSELVIIVDQLRHELLLMKLELEQNKKYNKTLERLIGSLTASIEETSKPFATITDAIAHSLTAVTGLVGRRL